MSPPPPPRLTCINALNHPTLFYRAMVRYWFDTDDGETISTDQVGLELDGLETARAQALRSLADMAWDVLPSVDERTFATAVRLQNGTTVFRTSLTLKNEWLG